MAATGTPTASTSETQSSIHDSSNVNDPLFLHHGENPGAVLVSQPLIGGENYPAWARSVRKSLIAKNKLGFIDGSLTLSSPIVDSPTAVQAWIRADNMVGTWIINSISPRLQASVVYRETALEIWNDLRDTFCHKNGPKIFNLQKQISELHQGEVSITDFFTQLKVLWDQLQSLNPFPLCTCGKCQCNINQRLTDLQAKESVMKFLMGLNDSFSQVRTQILLMDPLPPVNKVHSLLIQEEMQRSVSMGTRVESTALATKTQNFTNGGSNGKGKERPLCTHCGKLGHTIDKCYKLHGFPPGYKSKTKSMAHLVSSTIPDQFQNHMALTSQEGVLGHAPVTTQAPSFTTDQYQQLLALIGALPRPSQQNSTGQEYHMANTVGFPNNTVAVFHSGLASNGQPVFASGALPGGQRFPPLGSAPQRPVRPPPTTTSRPLMGSSPIRAPPVQPASPFSAAPQARQPPTTGYPYGRPTWPLQPGQGAPPPPITGSPQPPRMFGMPPPLPNWSMTSVSPAVGQTGAPVAGASKIDPNQIPRPIPDSSVILHETRQGNQANPPPPATSDYIVRDTGNCSPRYMRCTINQIPFTDDLLTTSGMQLALMVQPLAIPHPSEETVQVVDFGESGPVRCSRCKGYINPFMKFIDQGRRFICNFCGFTDETPREYHCNLGPDGRRRDSDERPELCRGTVEFVASREYMVRDPMPAVYFFLIDVSINAIQTGATAAACGAINQVIADLPEGPRTMVGIATFDSTIHFYNLKRALQQPLMLVVPDVQDVYTPLQTDVVVQLSECRQHLELLLESIPTMFLENRTAESAFGAATKAAFMAMKSTGGRLLVFQSVLPSIGIGALSAREAEGRTHLSAGEKEAHKLLQPADETLKAMAIEFAEYQVCVDVFITTQTYVDIASIAVIPRTTGGQVYYYYPFSAVSDPAKLYNDLRWNVTRPQGFEAVMRVRCSQGIQVLEYDGNFYKRMPTDVDLPGIDCDKAIMVTLKHDDKLKDGSECAFQCALLYTTVNGQRRIRVNTLSLPCTSILSNLFRLADLDTQFACFLKQAASEIPSRPLFHVMDRMTNLCINILLSYRKFCATVTSSGQLILPEALKLLPLYTLALIKSTGLRTDGRIGERSFWINYLSSISTPLAIPFVHPRMVAIHDLNSKEGDQSLVPPVISLSTEHVNDGGIYLLENGEDCLIYIGNSVDSDILRQLFCISSVDEIPAQFVLQQYDNPLSKKLNDLVNEIRRQRCSYLRLKLCKKGDPSGMLFFSYMIEDKSSSGLSYVEFLVHVHRQIQLKMSS